MGLGGKHKRSHHEPDFSKKTVMLLVILGTIEIEVSKGLQAAYYSCFSADFWRWDGSPRGHAFPAVP